MVYYYKNKFPDTDDIVIGIVEKISEYGIEVSLIEYNGLKGFINCGEVSRKKRVNFNKIFTVGKEVLLHVMQVDQEKGFVDLSKRTIGDDDIKAFKEKHKIYLHQYNVFKQLFMRFNKIDKPELIDETNLYNFMCGSLFEIQSEFSNENFIDKFLNKDSYNEFVELIDFELIGYDKELFVVILLDYIETKVNRTKPELTETIKLMTYNSTGLADIKYALDFKNFSNYPDLSVDFEIKINYISSSVYAIILAQKELDLISNISIEDVIGLLKQEIKARAIKKNIQNQIAI
jgi:translation initiation factor 2 alpha subunit (eIF-2alpha)